MPVRSLPEFRITANSLLYDDVVKSVSLLKEELEDFCKKETKKISDRGKVVQKFEIHYMIHYTLYMNIIL